MKLEIKRVVIQDARHLEPDPVDNKQFSQMVDFKQYSTALIELIIVIRIMLNFFSLVSVIYGCGFVSGRFSDDVLPAPHATAAARASPAALSGVGLPHHTHRHQGNVKYLFFTNFTLCNLW